MITVTIPIEEYEKLKENKNQCLIHIENYTTSILQRELAKYRIMIEIMSNENKFKHDKIRVPTMGEFSVTELKKEIEQITGSKYK